MNMKQEPKTSQEVMCTIMVVFVFITAFVIESKYLLFQSDLSFLIMAG